MIPPERAIAFVAGATGLTGRFVVEALRRRGITTHAHVRPDSSRLAHWQAHFQALGAVVDTTPWTQEAMNATFRALEPDLIFALLGTTRKRMQAEQTDYSAIDYGLTKVLIDAALAASGKKRPRFTYLSSQGVKEGTRNAYLAARVQAEAAVRASGLPFTLARPSFITGDRDESRPGERVGVAVADSFLAVARVLGGRALADRYAGNDAADLAECLVRCALDPAFEGQVAEGRALRRG